MKLAMVAAALFATAAQAQPGLVARKNMVGTVLPSNSEIWLSLNGGLSSRGAKVGDMFDLVVARDIMMGDHVVIPRGTPAHGRISYRTGKGAFGKSAKIEFDLVDVVADGQKIPLSGHYRIEGQGNTGAAIGVVVAVGVLGGALVTGHSAIAAQGSEWKAYTQGPVPIVMASYDVPAAAPGDVTAPVVVAAAYAATSPYPGAQWILTGR